MSKSIKSQFYVEGYFYELDGISCRRFLKIKHLKSSKEKPDLRVVMMNPGSSESHNADYLDKWTPTEPDLTQSYIMKLMLSIGFEYAIILNLSDIREKDSDSFYYKLGKCAGQNIKTSVFESQLSKDDRGFLDDPIPTIAAWGVSDVLNDLAKIVIKKYNGNLIGVEKNNGINGTKYFHPLMRAEKGNGWVNLMISKLKEKSYVQRKTIK